MRLFGYGKLEVRAVGYNHFFLKAQPILPFLKAKALPTVLSALFPEIDETPHERAIRSWKYDLITRKWLIPFFCLSLAPLMGWGWLISAAISALIVFLSVLLEYFNTDFVKQTQMIILSKGGFYRTTAWIYLDRIELISISASRRKKQKGFVNVRLKVFGKQGTYALVRNIDIARTYPFDLQ